MKNLKPIQFLILLCTGLLSFQSLKASPTDLFISEYVEGSSNNKAIEIYNGTGAAIDLAAAGYKIEMYFNGSATVGLTINLTGTITANNVFILAQTSAVLPITPNQTNGAGWYNGNDAVVLKKGTTIIDVIGQIGFNPGTEWGTGNTSTADNTIRRKSSLCKGDTSAFDAFDPSIEWDGFLINEFSGLGSHTAPCATLSSLAIAPSSLNFSTSVGIASSVESYTLQGNALTSDVTVTSPAQFEISFNFAGPFSSGLLVTQADAIAGKLIYVRYNPSVSGPHIGTISHTSGSASANLSVQGSTSNNIPVYTIQGTGASSAYDGSIVTTEGLVVGDFQGTTELKGFYIQDTIGDGNPLSSDGIFVFNSSLSVNVGDYVKLTGEVDEFFNLTELKNITNLTVLASGKTIAPSIITLPVAATTDLENYEGMFVKFSDTLTVTENFNLGRFGELLLSSQGRLFNPTNYIDPNDNPASGTNSAGTSNVGAVLSQQNLNLRRSILLDDASSVQNPAIVPYIDAVDKTLRCGTTIANLTGVLDFAFGNYRVQPTSAPAFNYAARPTVPSLGAANVKIASFNVLNYFNGDGLGGGFPTARGANTLVEFNRQRTKIIEGIHQMNADIVGLMEMENDGDGVNSAIADLVNGLNAITGAGTYTYIADPTGSNGNSGTDAIKVSLIYKPASVNPVGLSKGDTNSINSRFPIAQVFAKGDSKFTVIVNHFKSKSSSNASGLDIDQLDGQGAYNNTRKLQANALLAFITNLQTITGVNDVISIGDYNAYEQEDPMDILAAGGLNNQTTGSYSYVFSGNAGSLDHALITSSLFTKVTGAEKWHINADEPRLKDYNQEFNPAYVYSPDAFRSSDHDPLILGLNIQPQTFKLQMLHASDLEGGVEALPRASNFAAIIDKLEDEYPNTVRLLGGDNWIPGPFFNAAADRTVLDPVLRNLYNGYFGAGTSNNLRASEGRIDMTIMNLIGFDASAVGNHEFDAGSAKVADIIGYEISGTQVRWMGAQFPYLSSNLDFSGDASLSPLFTNEILENTKYISRPDTLKTTSPKRKIAPATIIVRNGEKIGVVGATTQLLESISSPGGVKVKGSKTNNMTELATYIQPVIDQLKGMGVNKIILASHLQQLSLEKSLIGLLSGVDIVIAAGSSSILADANDVLWSGDSPVDTYPIVSSNKDGEPALIVSTDQEYKYVGRLVVEFDANGVILLDSLDTLKNGPIAATDANVVALWGSLANAYATGTKAQQVKTLTDAVKSIVIAQDGNIFGKTNVYLEGKRTEVRTQETNLGNLTADANLGYAKSYDSTVVVSIKNGGGIRASIGEVLETSPGVYEKLPPQANPLSGKQTGEVSQLDILNALRFNNGLTLLTLTPAQLLQTVNHGVATVAPGATPGQFPQVGGISFSYDPTLPAGSRVKNLTIVDENNHVVDLIAKDGVLQGDPSRKIRVVTLNFLAGGGDSYPFPSFTTANPAFSNRVDLVVPGAPKTGTAIFADNGSELDAMAEYLLANHDSIPFNKPDTDMSNDKRIQNLSVRPDSVLIAPQVAITSPVNGVTFTGGSLITINVNAFDSDGSIAKVEFFVNSIKIGEDSIAPYQSTWTGVIGNATLTAIATDNIGLQTISSALTITITDPCITLTVNAGNDKIVKYGYAPQACATLIAQAAGGTAPYIYSWSNGQTANSISVCPTVDTTYTVTITDANGCRATDEVFVCVENVKCTNNNVFVCGTFVLQGQIISKKTFCVSQSAATKLITNNNSGFLRWNIGSCSSSVCGSNGNRQFGATELTDNAKQYLTDDEYALIYGDPSVKLYPNPTNSASAINIEFLNIRDENVEVTVRDITGKMILKKQMNVNEVNQQLDFEYALLKGFYIVNVITTQSVMTEKLIVQ